MVKSLHSMWYVGIIKVRACARWSQAGPDFDNASGFGHYIVYKSIDCFRKISRDRHLLSIMEFINNKLL